MRKAALNLILVTACLLSLGSIPASGQNNQLMLGDSLTEFDFYGTNSSTINHTIRSASYTYSGALVPCTAVGWLFAFGSAAGSGSLASSGSVSCTATGQFNSG